MPFGEPLFADARSDVVLYAPAGVNPPPCEARLTHHEFLTGEDDLSQILRALRRDHGVRSLLCEGGPMLFNSLLREDLVDELFLTVSPTLVGGAELGITTWSAVERDQASTVMSVAPPVAKFATSAPAA